MARKTYSPSFKMQVVLEAIKEDRTDAEGSSAEEWEDGELGKSLEHAERGPEEHEEQLNEMIDNALELKKISIRLQEGLVEALKTVARRKGIGYQPLIRQILNEYVRESTDG